MTLEVRKDALAVTCLLERFAGLDGLQAAYRRVLAGEVRPDRGVIVDLQGSG